MVFAPPVEEVYPAGFATTVELRGPITETFEGAVRGPEHFWGVATVVTKLFGMVQPDVAYFGQKDAQQCVVVTRLVTDLDLPVELVDLPDGARGRRPRHVQPQRAPPRRRPRAGARPGRGARRRRRRRARRRDRRRRGGERRHQGDAGPRRRADYVAVVDPTTLAPAGTHRRPRPARRGRPRRAGPPHRQRLSSAATDMSAPPRNPTAGSASPISPPGRPRAARS